MRLPKSVVVLHRTFEVVALEEDLRACVNDDGLIDFESDRITINTGMSDAQILETLLHEISHAVNAVAALSDQSNEEEHVTRATPVWLAVWRDNPALLDLLCEWTDS